MIIEFANVSIHPKKYELRFAPSEIDLELDDVTVNGETAFDGETVRKADEVIVSGNIASAVESICVRCLEKVDSHIAIEFADRFVESTDDVPTELSLDAEDLDVGHVYDGTIDLKEVVREQVILALPEQVFCSDGCQGLCPKCGANRNLIDCKCIEAEVDPRWAALKSLK